MKTENTNPVGLVGTRLTEAVWHDARLRSVHICLYVAILFECNKAGQVHIQISRRILMGYARIKAFSTYHSGMRDLARFCHIVYEPSFHPLLASRIVLSGMDHLALNYS